MAATALSETGNDRIRPGGNMTPFELISGEIESLYEEAKNWADGSDIENDEQLAAVDTLDKALLKAGQEADNLREEEKEPLKKQVDAIQARYHPLIGDTKAGKGKVPMARTSLEPIRTRYKTKKAAEAAAAAAKARAEFEEQQRIAREAMKASSGNLEAREQAEQQQTAAKAAEKIMKKAEKAATTGLGLRPVWEVQVNDPRALAAHYWKTRSADVDAFFLGLAKSDVHGGARTIPGCTVTEQKRAI